jgi:hypothetical protein
VTAHRAEPKSSFSWRRALLSGENWIVLFVGFTMGEMVFLWAMSAVMPKVTMFAAVATALWALASAVMVWMKGTDGHRR